jgi:(1->4)-alpha-D-glucan 1-alpha-D-glucosylmutase
VFPADLLLLRLDNRTPLEDEWVMRFQQVTGPAMAKGVEDTAFYRATRLLVLNEVGGDPARFGVPVDAFHEANAGAHERWPTAMTALSTHDTKRSADVRARLALLSEIPDAWADMCGRWMAASARHWPGGDPDRHTQHLLFQTLVGAWPLTVERAAAYLEKATREAKVRTSWTQPDPAFDRARDAWVAGVFADEALMADVAAFVAPLVEPGRVAALAQALLQLTAPGVPDTYQGTELWDLSLVDPDNRRPVDFGLRRALLATVGSVSADDLRAALAEPDDPGVPKLRVVREALHLRRRLPAVFGAGEAGAYAPLPFAGPAAAYAVGFTRGAVGPDDRGPAVAVVVPRLVVRLAAGGGWADTAVTLPPGRWNDLLTGATRDIAPSGDPDGPARQVPLAELLAAFPVALLERTP